MKPAGLIAISIERWGVKLSTDQAYRAKRKAMELLQGAGRDQFTHLRSYAQELLNSNPNSNVILKCSDSSNGPVFERVYVCLNACKTAFAKFCRPLIGLDACFLKGDYGGQLMAAVGSDGNNQIFPIAYAVVEAETKDSWEWFINLLLEDLQSVNNVSYAFISDQQKGLVPAVQGVSEHVEQRLCVKHLYGNWKKKFSGLVLKEVFWSAARATTIPEWERAMIRLKALNEDAWKDINEIPARFWSRSHYKTHVKCDLQVNNWCEAFNRAILEHRDKPIISLLEGIKHYITKRITSHKEMMQKYNGVICPNIQVIVEKNKKNAHGWTPTWHGDDDMAIFGVTNGMETFCINLKDRTCSCRKWMLNGIPCSHAISCMWQMKKSPEEYVDDYYKTAKYLEYYGNIIYPTNGPQLWPVIDGVVAVNPPLMRRAIGRPKKMRNKSNDEPRNPNVLPRTLSTVSCRKCGAVGHNIRSCKGKRAADRSIPVGGNKKEKTKGAAKGKGASKGAAKTKGASKGAAKTKGASKGATKGKGAAKAKAKTKGATKAKTNEPDIASSSQGPPATQPTQE
ncbi:uncharacterized protein LOC131657557 [Vicia villosa]|uniref:uncharacterized protein LOC131657557 n=1 Tax=Vicia villosa TaxID=3911 RepID=UPI00273C66B5|nr:uncharacterized protein LOC131657557 [Vicia villosa]